MAPKQKKHGLKIITEMHILLHSADHTGLKSCARMRLISVSDQDPYYGRPPGSGFGLRIQIQEVNKADINPVPEVVKTELEKQK